MRLQKFCGVGIASVLARCGWFTVDGRSRAYYGVRIGPFLLLFSRWKKSKEAMQ